MYLGVGPLRLEQLVTRVLINLRDYIGDIGDTPVTLLTPVLEQCNAAQLALIEDDTRQGGRDIHNDLAVHWLRCYRTDFGGSPAALSLLSNGRESPDGQVPPGDWRLGYDVRGAYEAKVEAAEQRKREVGKRLRAMWEETEREKAERSMQVIQPQSRPRKRANVDPRSTISSGALGSRERLLKKLGMKNARTGPEMVRAKPSLKHTVTAPGLGVRSSGVSKSGAFRSRAVVSTSQKRSAAAQRVLEGSSPLTFPASPVGAAHAISPVPQDSVHRPGPRPLLTGRGLLELARSRKQAPTSEGLDRKRASTGVAMLQAAKERDMMQGWGCSPTLSPSAHDAHVPRAPGTDLARVAGRQAVRNPAQSSAGGPLDPKAVDRCTPSAPHSDNEPCPGSSPGQSTSLKLVGGQIVSKTPHDVAGVQDLLKKGTPRNYGLGSLSAGGTEDRNPAIMQQTTSLKRSVAGVRPSIERGDDKRMHRHEANPRGANKPGKRHAPKAVSFAELVEDDMFLSM